MSNFTTQLRYICESLAGYDKSQGYMTIDDVISKSWEKIFPPSFETFTKEYRPVLAKKILKWYYTREIGCETFGLWQLRLDAKLSVIMPIYNKMYEAMSLDYDILHNVDMTTTHTRDSKGNNTASTSAKSTSDASGKVTDRHSNTPQGGLDGIESNRYLSSADIRDNSSNNSNESSGSTKANFDSTEDFVQKVVGKNGSMSNAQAVSEYIEKLKNVDRMLINDLSDLFMTVYEWGDFIC